jgi:hypothetical protein
VQPVFVEFRVVPHDIAQRGQAAVVHVGCGQRQIAQRRHLELAEVAMFGPQVSGSGGVAPCCVVVFGAEQVVRTRQKVLDAALAAGVDAPRLDEEGHADVTEFAIGEEGPGVAGGALSPAEENLQAAPGRGRVGRCCLAVTGGQGGTEAVERGRRRNQGLLPGRDGFRDIHQQLRVTHIGRLAERAAIVASQVGPAA